MSTTSQPPFDLDLGYCSELLESEVRLAMTHANEDFLIRFRFLISEILSRFPGRVARLNATGICRLVVELVHGLGLCFDDYGDYQDASVASICIRLRLQRRLLKCTEKSRKQLGPALQVA